MSRKNWVLSWVCPETGKRGFPTRKEAKQVRRRECLPDMNTYHCQACDGFHNGSKLGATRSEHRAMHRISD